MAGAGVARHGVWDMTTAQEEARLKTRLKRVSDKRGLAAHIPEKKRTNKARPLKPAEVAEFFSEAHVEMNGVLLGAVDRFRTRTTKSAK